MRVPLCLIVVRLSSFAPAAKRETRHIDSKAAMIIFFIIILLYGLNILTDVDFDNNKVFNSYELSLCATFPNPIDGRRGIKENENGERTMSLVSSITLIVTVIIIYYALIRIFAVLFRITGLPKEKSIFQAVSLLTNAGFTTGESEIIVSEKTRRHIATAAMLTGYFFSVLIVSLFINLFLSIDFSAISEQIHLLFLEFGGMIAFLLILRIPVVDKAISKGLDGVTVKLFKKTARENYISVLDTYGKDAVVNIFLYRVPEFLEGKCIVDTDMRKKYNVNILMYTRNGQNHHVTADTIFSKNDVIIAFGPLSSIKDAFLLKERTDKQDRKRYSGAEENVISIMSNFGYQIMADIKLNRVPPMLADKSLLESRIKDYFSINIMMVSRNEETVSITKDTVLEKGDRVIAFGPYESINTVFGYIRNSDPEE